MTFDPLRLESGFLDYRNLGECTALFSSHQREALDEADTLKVTIASAECADCGGLRYSPLCDGTRYSSGTDSYLCTRALLTLPQTSEPTRLRKRHLFTSLARRLTSARPAWLKTTASGRPLAPHKVWEGQPMGFIGSSSTREHTAQDDLEQADADIDFEIEVVESRKLEGHPQISG